MVGPMPERPRPACRNPRRSPLSRLAEGPGWPFAERQKAKGFSGISLHVSPSARQWSRRQGVPSHEAAVQTAPRCVSATCGGPATSTVAPKLASCASLIGKKSEEIRRSAFPFYEPCELPVKAPLLLSASGPLLGVAFARGSIADGSSDGRASYAPAPCPNPILVGSPQFDLGAEFECGYLTVPENRALADDRTVRIAVARLKATAPNPKPDPIVFLTGGPEEADWRKVRLLRKAGTLSAT